MRHRDLRSKAFHVRTTCGAPASILSVLHVLRFALRAPNHAEGCSAGEQGGGAKASGSSGGSDGGGDRMCGLESCPSAGVSGVSSATPPPRVSPCVPLMREPVVAWGHPGNAPALLACLAHADVLSWLARARDEACSLSEDARWTYEHVQLTQVSMQDMQGVLAKIQPMEVGAAGRRSCKPLRWRVARRRAGGWSAE
eukprot:94214-Chlamydomonas_euryale.AAC.1